MNKTKIILSALFFAASAIHATSATAAIPLTAQPDANVSFLAVGKPSMLKIHGKAKGMDGTFELDKNMFKGKTTFALEKLDTGISLRNSHMKDKYLQVQKYPTAVLTIEPTAVDADFEKTLTTSGEKKFKGMLSLHGQEKPVEGVFTAKNGSVSAKFSLKLTDFGVDIPSYLGVTVAENVEVNVDLQLKK